MKDSEKEVVNQQLNEIYKGLLLLNKDVRNRKMSNTDALDSMCESMKDVVSILVKITESL